MEGGGGGAQQAQGATPAASPTWLACRPVQGRLLVTYSLVPHKVYELGTDGTALLQHTTEPGEVFAAKLGRAAARQVHGGPPVVLVQGSKSGSLGRGAAEDGGEGAGGRGLVHRGPAAMDVPSQPSLAARARPHHGRTRPPSTGPTGC